METRAYAAELRVERREGKTPKLYGYAAVFDSESNDLGGFTERIAKGAFDGFEDRDVKALVNHNSDIVLGSRKGETLKLKQDDHGLRFELDLPDTSGGRDIAVSVERQDVSGMSFRFLTVKDKWEKLAGKGDDDGGRWLRTLLSVRLIEVSPTAFPAYPATEVDVRARAETKDAAEGLAAAKAAEAARVRRLGLLERETGLDGPPGAA